MSRVSDTFEFFYQLNTLSQTNMPIVEALSILGDSERKYKGAKKSYVIAKSILESVQKGYSFSQALLFCPYIFISKGTVNLFHAAERAANLKDILVFVCKQNEKRMQIKLDIQNTMIYPLIVIAMALVGTLFLINWKDLFLINVSIETLFAVIIRALIILLLLLFLLAVFVFDSLKEHPLFQFYYALAFLQRTGFTFCKSLELFMDSHFSNISHERLSYAYNEISKGYSVSAAFTEAKLATDKMVILIGLAEKTGSISQVCSQIAQDLLVEHEKKKKKCAQLIEPLLLFIVGIYLAVLMEGIFIPYITDFGGVL